jgi:hypothetical protein
MRVRPLWISIAVHATVVAAVVWTTATSESREPQDLAFFGDMPPDSIGGVGGLGGLGVRTPPPLGPSLSPADAKAFLGQYSFANPGRANVEMLISHAKDDMEHWSLIVHEGSRNPYKLVPAARDSFFQQLSPTRRFVFVRRDSAVIAIELHYRGEIRRGVKVPAR